MRKILHDNFPDEPAPAPQPAATPAPSGVARGGLRGGPSEADVAELVKAAAKVISILDLAECYMPGELSENPHAVSGDIADLKIALAKFESLPRGSEGVKP